MCSRTTGNIVKCREIAKLITLLHLVLKYRLDGHNFGNEDDTNEHECHDSFEHESIDPEFYVGTMPRIGTPSPIFEHNCMILYS